MKTEQTTDVRQLGDTLNRLIAQHRAGRTPDADQFGAIHRQAIAAAKQAEADDDTDATERALSVADTAKAHQELAAQLEKPLPRVAAPSNPSSAFGPTGSSEAVVTNWVDRRTGKTVPVLGKGQRLADITPGANEVSMGAALRGLITGNWTGAEREQALATNNNSAGGYLVPDVLSARVIDKARNMSVLGRLGAQTVPMDGSTLRLARVSGDPTIESKVENDSFAGSSITFDSILLNAHTLGTVITLSRELLDDAPNAADVIENTLAGALAQQMDAWMLSGSGSAQPLGVMNQTGVQEIDSVGGITYDDILDAIEDLETVNAEATGFVATPLLSTALRKITVNSESAHYAQPPEIVRALPWLTSNQVASGELYIGDWSKVLIGVRQTAQIEVSNDASEAFDRYQVKVRIVWRGDANVEHADHLLKLTGATA